MSPYSHTSEPGTVGNKGEILLFPFIDLPLAVSNVDISVFLKGDLNGGSKWYYLEGENTLVGYPARYVTQYEECGAFVKEDFVMTDAEFNFGAVDGNFRLQMRPFRNYIDPGTCAGGDGNQAYIVLSYVNCELPSSTPSSMPSQQPSSRPSSEGDTKRRTIIRAVYATILAAVF
jgi:hypothetical protein